MTPSEGRARPVLGEGRISPRGKVEGVIGMRKYK